MSVLSNNFLDFFYICRELFFFLNTAVILSINSGQRGIGKFNASDASY